MGRPVRRPLSTARGATDDQGRHPSRAARTAVARHRREPGRGQDGWWGPGVVSSPGSVHRPVRTPVRAVVSGEVGGPCRRDADGPPAGRVIGRATRCRGSARVTRVRNGNGRCLRAGPATGAVPWGLLDAPGTRWRVVPRWELPPAWLGGRVARGPWSDPPTSRSGRARTTSRRPTPLTWSTERPLVRRARPPARGTTVRSCPATPGVGGARRPLVERPVAAEWWEEPARVVARWTGRRGWSTTLAPRPIPPQRPRAPASRWGTAAGATRPSANPW